MSEPTREIRNLIAFYEGTEREIIEVINKVLLAYSKGDYSKNLKYLLDMQKKIKLILLSLRSYSRDWCKETISDTYTEGMKDADEMIKKVTGEIKMKTGFGKVHREAAKVLAENTYNRFNDVVDFIGRRTDDLYRTLAIESVRGSVIGYETWQEVADKFKKQLAEQGITGFQDKAGRNWNMSSYAKTVARTTTMEAHLQGTSNRLLEQGHDLIKISRHAGACHLCIPWEGKILSLTGKTPGYPTLEEAKEAGLFHPNCRHAYGLHIDLDEEIRKMEEEERGFVSGAEPEPTPQTKVPKMQQDWVNSIENNDDIKYGIRTVCANESLTKEEYKKQVTSWLEKGLKDAPLKIRADIRAAEQILKDGRFKSQFESGSSGGMFNPQRRAEFEEKLFGIDQSEMKDRPIYGYAFGGRSRGSVNHYGDVVFILKDSVRRRTTFTVRDSLDENGAGRWACTTPSPLNNPDYRSVTPQVVEQVIRDKTGLSGKGPSEVRGYTELQYHGGVSISDVKEVIFTDYRPNKELQATLKKEGISWEYNDNYTFEED